MCWGEQPNQPALDYVEDIKNICNVRELSGGDADGLGSVGSANLVGAFLRESLKTSKAKKMMERMPKLAMASKASVLLREAKKVGIDKCPMATD